MKRHHIIIKIFWMFIIVSVATSCYYDSEEYLYPGSACDTTNVTFSGTVSPILSANCNLCHNSNLPNGGVLTDNHAGLINSVNSGVFWKAINHEPGALPMPQNGLKLPACELLKIRTWINQGAPNN